MTYLLFDPDSLIKFKRSQHFVFRQFSRRFEDKTENSCHFGVTSRNMATKLTLYTLNTLA